MAINIVYSIKKIQEKYSLSNKVPLFATQEYADYLLESKNIKTLWFIKEDEEQISFIIPFAVKSKLLFKKGYFLTAVNNIGFNSLDKEKEFLEEAIQLIKKNKLCDWIQQPPNWALFRAVPLNSIFCAFGTYKTDLENNNENELFNKLKHDTRSQINRAISCNVIVKSGPELIEDGTKVFMAAASLGNKTLPSKKEIEILMEYLHNNIKIYVAYINTIPKSCVIFLVNNYCLYAVYAGLIPSREKGVNQLLYWQAIKEAKQSGIKYFDFVGARIEPMQGSKQEYIQRFKKHFGGEFIKGYLWKMPISNHKYKLYNLLLKTIYFVKLEKYKGDIIDQELKKNKVKESILTVDYELFLGEKTGSVKECMIEPTSKIISFLEKNNSKMTVFWDILHFYQLLQYEEKYPELREDRLLIEEQILDLVRQGHDIQLHLHPHWLDAQYKNGKWIFQYDRFKLHKLSNENKKDNINTIIGCISISKNLIENLIRSVNPDYKITTYRAGGYLLEPFSEISDALIVNGINIDSSVCPGLYNKNGIFSYDFRYYPQCQKYKYATTPKVIDNNGKYMEFPITTIKLSIFRNIYYKLLRKIKYTFLENERKGIGAEFIHHDKQKSKINRLLSILFVSPKNQFTTDSNFREKFNYLYKKAPEYATMIVHPKLLNHHTLKILDEYLSNNKIHFISIKDFIPK